MVGISWVRVQSAVLVMSFVSTTVCKRRCTQIVYGEMFYALPMQFLRVTKKNDPVMYENAPEHVSTKLDKMAIGIDGENIEPLRI